MITRGKKQLRTNCQLEKHDDVIKWKPFPRYWPFVQGIHRSPVNSPHNGQWCWALMVFFINAWINSWVNNRQVDDLRCHRAHYDVIVMTCNLVDELNMKLLTAWRALPWLVKTHLPLNKMAAILADDIFKCIFLKENIWISPTISLKFALVVILLRRKSER